MPEGDETAPLRPEARAADERAAAIREVEAAAARATPDDHRVLDAYVARRLAQESAARAEAERRSAEAISGLRGEEPPGPATGFYLLLGVIVAALLLAVIWLSAGSPPPH